ncbi:MAG: hypothetical protein ISS31_10625 [Kiritimatiellae bacterium]|nr:hypothetical protein [Kiritimatiellia bacterium]
MTVSTAQHRNAKSADVATIVRQRIDEGIYDYQLPGMALLADEMGLNERTVMRGVAILEDEGPGTICPGVTDHLGYSPPKNASCMRPSGIQPRCCASMYRLKHSK